MRRHLNNQGFSLMEALLAAIFTMVIVMVLANFHSVSRVVYSVGISDQLFQEGVNIILKQINQGKTEPTGVYRLSEAVSYSIVSLNELNFVGTDGITRSYRLNAGSNQLIYRHPTSAGTVDEVIYTAPSGSVITLRFSMPTVANYPSAVVNVDAAITQNIFGRTASGSSSTIIHLRNHP